jgi:acyl-CoA synthetase (AMP-forming)/AMP-acid ligase II
MAAVVGRPIRVFISNLLERAAVTWPRRSAIIDGDVHLTYADLHDRIGRLANALLGLGLQPGDRVLDIQKNAHTYIETDLAFAVAGLVRVPVNVRLTTAEWAYIANNSGARGLVYGPDFGPAMAALLEPLDRIQVVVRIGAEGPGLDYEQLLAKASPAMPHRWPTAEEVLSLNYSSGTTGRPKGCMRTAANRYVSTCDVIGSVFGGALGRDDVFLHAGPLTHASGLFVLAHIAVGATQVLLPRFDAEEVAQTLERAGVTGTVLVPTMVERLLDVLDAAPDRARFPALKRLAYAGAPMAPARIASAADALGGRLVQFYGMVEAIPPITVLTPADHRSDDLRRSAGRPTMGSAVAVIDDHGAPVQSGVHGELVIGGLHVMAGYWADDEATDKSLEDGWLRTGDMAWQDDDGYVYLVDRKSDMIITGGFNVMPREIELVLEDAPDIAEVAVVGIPDTTWGEAVTAFVVPRPGVRIDPEALHALCTAKLSGFKRPKRIEVVRDLPKTSTGKVSRSALRDRATREPPR